MSDSGVCRCAERASAKQPRGTGERARMMRKVYSLIVNCWLQLPESPKTGGRLVSRCCEEGRRGLLTDEAVVVAGYDVGHGDLHASRADVEVMGQEHYAGTVSCKSAVRRRRLHTWSTDLARAEGDEAPRVGDLLGCVTGLPAYL